MAPVLMTPTFVVVMGAARSGTTLLRLMLDAHDEVGCPGEAGIPSVIQHMASMWRTVDAEVEGTHELSTEASSAIRAAVTHPMQSYCARHGKRVYCDKSLDSVHHLGLVEAILPDTKFIFMVRHVMDTVASGVEASPWGFQSFGYLPFVQASPDNWVAALVAYWIEHVGLARRWEAEHSSSCYRIRYEDLVAQPEAAMAGVWDFIGVSQPTGDLVGTALQMARRSRSSGDYYHGQQMGDQFGSM